MINAGYAYTDPTLREKADLVLKIAEKLTLQKEGINAGAEAAAAGAGGRGGGRRRTRRQRRSS